jgi:DNA-binding response OmpR family regulator
MLKKSDSFSSTDRKRIESMHANAKELLEMINQLLDFRRMELGEAQLNVKNGNIVDFINTAIETFHPMAARKQITLSFNKPSKSLYINFDHEKLHYVIWNLLSNAMKFSKEGGNVTVGLEQKDSDKIEIRVSDTGIGIAPEHLSHIFERYYQASDSHAEGGSGIGLHMVSELIHMHGGDVTVDSELGKGTTFRFTLPMNLPLSQVHTIAQPEPGETAADEYDSAVGGENKILLVEDNVEFRTMMAESLGEDGYSTLEAGNGEEALALLNEHEVSLVISDVMMPVMNGFDLCRRIKSDLSFSHIPLILLTAKTGDENQLEGYKMGADYYMTKPFSMDLLMNRISHLGAQRTQQQEAFQHEQENDVVGITRSKIDEEFLEKAISVMNEHIGDASFNVETFSQEMFTSRMTLYRKICNITGQTPNEFITTMRLKHAAQLLKETSASVAVISEQCGFSSPSYFSKNFKKMFGKLPKEYRMR